METESNPEGIELYDVVYHIKETKNAYPMCVISITESKATCRCRVGKERFTKDHLLIHLTLEDPSEDNPFWIESSG